MVEVDQQRRLVGFAHDAGAQTPPVRQGELHDVADRISGVGIALCFEQRATDALQQVGVALAECDAGPELERAAYTFSHPEQARLYYDALSRAEVPNLRLVADQDFSFTAGLDVTDVRQTKGLEFDIVILLDVNESSYPATDEARRLLHVAMTRAAHQLWVTYTGQPSPLLPDNLR